MEQIMVSNKNTEYVYQQIFDVPPAHYRLIGWDIDTTGKQLDDEIMHVAGYYPNSQFSQYIMPRKDLSLFVERRYKIRVITVSHYRMLKDLKSNTLLETKAEKYALTDFISWLEKNRGESNAGIILIYHEVKKAVPLIFLEALRRHYLLDRFASVVKGFCNIYSIAKLKCTKTLNFFSLQVLSRILLNENDNELFRSAAARAKTYHAIIQRIIQKQDDLQGVDVGTITAKQVAEFARQYSQSTDFEAKTLRDLKDSIKCQNSLRPIFKDVMNFDWVSRMNASRLRSKLVESNIDFEQLQDAWDIGGKDAIIDLLKTVPAARQKDYADLLKILDCYFDPNKKPVYPNFCNRRRAIMKTMANGDQLIIDNIDSSDSSNSD